MLSLEDAHALRFALNRLNHPLMIVDRSLNICFANVAAEQLLQAADGLARRRGRLFAGCAHTQSRLARFSRAPADEGEFALELDRAASDTPLLLSATHTRAPGAPTGHLVITLHEPASPEPAPISERLRRFGLTPAEARVAGLAAQSLPVARIAARLSVSDNTVKTHLRSAYAKLGVASRAALARLAAQL